MTRLHACTSSASASTVSISAPCCSVPCCVSPLSYACDGDLRCGWSSGLCGQHATACWLQLHVQCCRRIPSAPGTFLLARCTQGTACDCRAVLCPLPRDSILACCAAQHWQVAERVEAPQHSGCSDIVGVVVYQAFWHASFQWHVFWIEVALFTCTKVVKCMVKKAGSVIETCGKFSMLEGSVRLWCSCGTYGVSFVRMQAYNCMAEATSV